MSNSFKATNKQIEKVMDYYSYCKINSDNNLFLFIAKDDDLSVTIYNNNTVLFQGKKADDELKMWNEIFNLKQDVEVIDHIGSDEVGCGDYFGPVVVTASLVKKEDYDYLNNLKVNDSKVLSDKYIQEIAPLIKDRIKTVTFVLSNVKYNELINQGFNTNKIKAYIHNFVLYNLVKNTDFTGKIIIDQFCSEALYYNYLSTYESDVLTNIYFTTKAESKYLAVACSSIIARDTFLKEIDKISKECGKKILLLGASSKVDELAKEILNEKGKDYLSSITKSHFANSKKIMQQD